MRSKLTKALLCILLSLLLVAVLPQAVFAEESDRDAAMGYTVWDVSEDGETLTADGRVYHRYYGERALLIDANHKYYYHYKVTLPDDGFEYAEICAPYRGAEIIWVYSDRGYGRVFATDTGAAQLDALIDGEVPRFSLMKDFSHRTPLTKDFIEGLELSRANGETLVTFPVSKLEDLPCYNIIAAEETGSLTYDYGAIYLFNGSYYYVNYFELDNSYFDSDGYFSYRKGSVRAARLGDALTESVKDALESAEVRDYSEEYEYDRIPSEENAYETEGARIVFWLLFVFVGYLLPAPFLILGLTLPHSAKRGKPKYWYSVAIVAGVWLCLAFLLMLVLIL